MSAKNGDKARFQKNRKRAVLRRAKMRELVKSAAAKATAAASVKAQDPDERAGDVGHEPSAVPE